MRFIDHIQRQHHRHAALGELRREQEHAPQVACVAHLDDELRGPFSEHAACDQFVFREDPLQDVDAWSVQNVADFGPDRRPSSRDSDGGSWVVRDGGVAARQVPEQNALANIGVADQGDA
jgi:hypothetical protein